MSSHILLENIDLSVLPKDSYIIEIGSAREPLNKENSTCFLNELAGKNHLNFLTVDFSKDSFALAKSYVGDKAILYNGVDFLKNFHKPIGILYLDNFDIIYGDQHRASLMSRVGAAYEEHKEIINNERSAEVHLEQAKAAMPLMTEPCFICIDDTMKREGEWWGKGATVVPFLSNKGFNVLKVSSEGVLLSLLAIRN
ncbi:MAG: hypothetical protein Q8M83_01565 [bacterium]|nr:hypothetical protein [bacterium]